MTRAFRSIAGDGVGVVNAPGIGVAGTVELSVTRFGVELISPCFSDLLHPATSRGKATTNAILRPELGSDYGSPGPRPGWIAGRRRATRKPSVRKSIPSPKRARYR